MNIITRSLFKSRISKIIRETYDNPHAANAAMYNTISVFRKLNREQLHRVWGHDYAPYMCWGSSLGTVCAYYTADESVLASAPAVSAEEQALADPLEWLTGCKRKQALGMMENHPDNPLTDITLTLWHQLSRYQYSKFTDDQRQQLLHILRRVLKGVKECL